VSISVIIARMVLIMRSIHPVSEGNSSVSADSSKRSLTALRWTSCWPFGNAAIVVTWRYITSIIALSLAYSGILAVMLSSP
jgi:hypothetical protein